MIQHTPETVLLHLSLIDGLGPAVVQRLFVQLTPDQLSQLYNFGISDIKQRCALPENLAQRIYHGLQDRAALERELQLLDKHDIAWVSRIHPKFPSLLKEIHLPPVGLYIQGTMPIVTSCLAVVGSRAANVYGQRVIDRLIPELCAQGTVIVSGGAHGIDTMAHKASVSAQSQTVAVLGSGLLRLYPSRNSSLFRRIVETGGALVSSFPLTMEALAGHFPARNRIIAGLSQGCLVVQAAKKSGALITAKYALEQGREVFAVPGAINDPLSAGCNNLLRQGATLVETALDILEISPIFTSKPVQMSIGDQEDSLSQSVLQATQSKQNSMHRDMVDQKVSLPTTADVLSDRLVALCAKPISVDDISCKLELDMFDVQSRLFALQMSGRVQQNFMGLWHI